MMKCLPIYEYGRTGSFQISIQKTLCGDSIKDPKSYIIWHSSQLQYVTPDFVIFYDSQILSNISHVYLTLYIYTINKMI